MVRGFSVVLGIGLVVMWIAGLGTSTSPAWMNWLDLVGAIGAFIAAGAVSETPARRLNLVIGPILLSAGLLILWIAGLTTGASVAMSWWNFVFGVAFGLVAVFGGSEGREKGEKPIESPFRRSA